MKRYRRKSREVEAVQFTGEPSDEIEVWLGDAFESWLPSRSMLAIRSGGVEKYAYVGNWIIKGYDGGVHVFTETWFEAEYEPVEEGQ